MKIGRGTMALISLGLVSAVAGAGEIYRWTDDQGNVRFSSTPPADAGRTETVGEHYRPLAAELQELPRRLTAHPWTGERAGKAVRWHFRSDGRFVEHVPGSAVRAMDRYSTRTYAGDYQFDHRSIVFRVSHTERGAEKIIMPPQRVTVEYYRQGVLKLRMDDGSVAYFRYDLSGNIPTFPEAMR